MLLFELADPDPNLVKVAAIASQLKSDIESNQIQELSTQELLDMFYDYGLVFDKTDLYNMIKKPPMSKVISNIQGDTVVFKGQEPEQPTDQDQSQEVVAQMAQDAMK